MLQARRYRRNSERWACKSAIFGVVWDLDDHAMLLRLGCAGASPSTAKTAIKVVARWMDVRLLASWNRSVGCSACYLATLLLHQADAGSATSPRIEVPLACYILH